MTQRANGQTCKRANGNGKQKTASNVTGLDKDVPKEWSDSVLLEFSASKLLYFLGSRVLKVGKTMRTT